LLADVTVGVVSSTARIAVIGASSAGTRGGSTEIVPFFAAFHKTFSFASGTIGTGEAVGTARRACIRISKVVAFHACAASISSVLALRTVGNSTFGTFSSSVVADQTVAISAKGTTSTVFVTQPTVLRGSGIVVSARLAVLSNSRGEQDSANKDNKKFVHF